MRRDDDLIRSLMMELEATTTYVNDQHPVPGYTRDQVAYHLLRSSRLGMRKGRNCVTREREAPIRPSPLRSSFRGSRRPVAILSPRFATTQYGPRSKNAWSKSEDLPAWKSSDN